jgi:hypothetical protein
MMKKLEIQREWLHILQVVKNACFKIFVEMKKNMFNIYFENYPPWFFQNKNPKKKE